MSKPETLMPPVHPGEILREDFMKPLGLSITSWRSTSTCRPPASVKLCTSAARFDSRW
jgi:plasmid maintenance system antidote protein VapI